jgi:hypothetical protein
MLTTPCAAESKPGLRSAGHKQLGLTALLPAAGINPAVLQEIWNWKPSPNISKREDSLTMATSPVVRVGVAAIVQNAQGRMVVGVRNGSHGEGWCQWALPLRFPYLVSLFLITAAIGILVISFSELTGYVRSVR